MNEDQFSPDLPEMMEDAVRHDENPDEYYFKNVTFSHVLIQNTPYIGSYMNTGPLSTINDGYNDIITQRMNAGRCALGKILVEEDSGNYFERNGRLRRDLKI